MHGEDLLARGGGAGKCLQMNQCCGPYCGAIHRCNNLSALWPIF